MKLIDDLYATRATSVHQVVLDPTNPDMQVINPPSLFDGSAFFSQVVVAPRGRYVWISGLIGCCADNLMVAGGKDAQVEQAFVNLRAAIAAGGCRPEHCVRVTEYIVDYSPLDIFLIKPKLEELFVLGRLPTNVIVPVPRLGRDGAMFELDAVCVLPD